MTNHIHLIVESKEGTFLEAIIRDFKRYTTQEIIKLIKNDNRKYLSWIINNSLQKKSTNKGQIWQSSNCPVVISSERMLNIKLNYIHNNPVKKGYVDYPSEWKYSSAKYYQDGIEGPVKITVPDFQ